MHPVLTLAGFLVLCFAAAGLGSLFTSRSVRSWYPGLRKPTGTPPSSWFGPVWSALYFLMALAAWIIYMQRGWDGARAALSLFLIQLALNVTWSAIFFGMRAPRAAFAEILVLWISIAATLVAFWKISMLAGLLLFPYLLWVTFAAFLNLGIWRLNRVRSVS